MQLTAQVFAQNEKDQVVILSSDAKGTEVVEWAAKGDPNGNDMQAVPQSVLNGIHFQRLINRGIISVPADANSPEVVDALDRQKSSFDARNSRAKEQIEATIETKADNDMITMPCIAPSGPGTCDVPVPMREKAKFDRPALCATHASLASQFLPHEDQVGTSLVKSWKRVTMGQRQSALS